MASFVIEGGHRLSGEIHPQGAKNEVLQIICATLLTAEEVTVDNIPDILDVNNLIQLMREMGVTVSKKGIDSYSFKAENVDLAYLESDEFLKKCSSLRGSVMLIGPMVARFGKALISKPGGDKIGRRRLDTHFLGIQNLGADFRYDEGRGIYEITADRLQGRGVYETPGGAILYKAINVLETITLDKESSHFKAQLAQKYADIVYNGQWFTPLREALDAFADSLEKTVTGDVKLKLYKGNMINAGVTSPYTLYDEQTASFGEDEDYNQADATGFINLFGLSIKERAKLSKNWPEVK